MQSEILAQVIRGDIIESVHRGHLIILDGDGKTVFSTGDPETVTFIRSSGKPFQFLPLLLNGAAERFGFTEDEIALACGSHSGEEIHVRVARKMLEKGGFDESDLRCGAHAPFYEKRSEEMMRAGEKFSQLHNNCSGKHAAMLAFARDIGADAKTYESMENPVQKAILEVFSVFTETPVAEIKIGIDGCAAPNFAVSLRAMAKSFAKLVYPPADFNENYKNACRKIVSAIMNYPELIGGTERLDTLMMQAAPGKFISKIGAEGVWLCGIAPSSEWKKGLGIALKIADGDDKRARAAVSIEILRQLGIFKKETLREFSPLDIKNRRKDVVGRVEASLTIA
jgi:L-asparaginase II